jgi:polysaccharide biosynthesis protein PelA
MRRDNAGRWMIAILFVLLTGSGVKSGSAQAGSDIPRTVLALYGGAPADKPEWSIIHEFAEMPLNHLGIKLHYHNIADGLPRFATGAEYIGVLSWYKSGTQLEDPTAYLLWAESVVRAGKKFVIMGDPGFRSFPDGRPVPPALLNRFLEKLGLQYNEEWIAFTYDLSFIVKDPAVVEFEKTYSGIIPPFAGITHNPAIANAHLLVRQDEQPSSDRCLVATSRQGGYVADGFAVFNRMTELGQKRQWYLNPFSFFRLVFATDSIPKPDTTTLAGRRLYFSHIDGDGWLNQTLIETYRQPPTMAARVILEEAIRPFPDLPVTIAPVVAELDPEWSGSTESMTVARELFALPQVEIGNHTYSHPFDWSFFTDGNPSDEIPYLSRYPGQVWQAVDRPGRLWETLTRRRTDPDYYQYNESGRADQVYRIPRAYAKAPFDLSMEVEGATAFLNELAPAGKKPASSCGPAIPGRSKRR